MAGVVSGKVSNGHGKRLAFFRRGGMLLLLGGRPGRGARAFRYPEQPVAGVGEEDLAVSAVVSRMPAQSGNQAPGSRSKAS